MLTEKVTVKPVEFVKKINSGPSTNDLALYIEEIKKSKNPIIIIGGSVCSEDAAINLEKVSEILNIPIYTSHRRQSYFNNFHKNNLHPQQSLRHKVWDLQKYLV